MTTLRLIGLVFICIALAVAVYDATRPADFVAVSITSLSDAWSAASPNIPAEHYDRLSYLPKEVQVQPEASLSDQLRELLLSLPLWLVVGLIGTALILLAHKRQSDGTALRSLVSHLLMGYGLIILASVAGVLVLDLSQVTQLQTGFAFKTLGEVWQWLDPGSLEATTVSLQKAVPDFWDPGVLTVLRLPVMLIAVLTGLGIYYLGSRPARSVQQEGSVAEKEAQSPRRKPKIRKPAEANPVKRDDTTSQSVSPELANSSKAGKTGFVSLLPLIALWVRKFLRLGRSFLGLWPPLLRAIVRSDSAQVETRNGKANLPDQTATSSQTTHHDTAPRSELSEALSTCKSAFLSIGLFSGLINVLMLSGAFFMLQIYDRVLPSRSVPTLVALVILVGLLYAFLATLDIIRSRLLVRTGRTIDDAMSPRVYDAIVRAPLKLRCKGDGLQPLRDLDAVRGFLSGPGPTALFDLPWLPLYLGIIFAFHPALGITALVGTLVLVTLTLMTEAFTRRSLTAASGFATTRQGLADASRRNAEVVAAMGMAGRLGSRWAEVNQNYLANHQQISDVAGGFGAVSKALRMMLQSAVLGCGAYLVINEVATAGVIIAAAILVGRALAPVDLAIANWKGFLGARQSWKRLTELLQVLPAHGSPMALPAPSDSLLVQHASAVPPGATKPVVLDANFELKSGQGLGIIGPSGSGKSSLVRMIVGAWPPARGRVRLDGAALDQWSSEALGHHVGYLPQDVDLLSGTVAENIARFEADADPQEIIAAAKKAVVHDLIVTLPQGYDTQIGDEGRVLSAGQRQRIALARALYRDPFLIVLDEPNSNLDADGEAALMKAIKGVRERGGIVIVVAHRPNILLAVDNVLAMGGGKVLSFGPKDEVLGELLAKKSGKRPPVKVVPEAAE